MTEAIWTCPDCGAVLGEADKLPQVVHVCHQRGAADLRRELAQQSELRRMEAEALAGAAKETERVLRAEIERLREERTTADIDSVRWENEAHRLDAEIERLRTALEQIYNVSREYAMYDVFRGFDKMQAIAKAALGANADLASDDQLSNPTLG